MLPNLDQALVTLETAYDHGITHFDAARVYGSGVCESIVGQFLRNKRDAVTVTTKLGLEPPAVPLLNPSTLFTIKKIVRAVPGVEAALRSLIKRQPVKVARFSTIEAERSLETSLKEMATDYVDALLLHECSLGEANAEEILLFLETVIRKGKVRYCGVGTAFANLPKDLDELKSSYSIVQFDSNVVHSNAGKITGSVDRLYITHSIFRPVSTLLEMAAPDDSDSSFGVGEDLRKICADKEKLGSLMLLAARQQNPHGIVLFASTRPGAIVKNIATWNSYEAMAAEVTAFQRDIDKLSFGR